MEDNNYRKLFIFKNSPYLKSKLIIISIFIILMSVVVIVETSYYQNIIALKNAPIPRKENHDPKQQDGIVRVKGTISKIIIPNQIYSVELITGEIINVSINSNTYLGYDQDENSNNPPKDTLSNIKPKQNLLIAYKPIDSLLNQTIPLTEFVIYNSQ